MFGQHPGVRLFSCDVWGVDLSEATLADADEVRTFAVEKRRREHLSARWLLAQVLREAAQVNPSLVMVVRDEYRAPRLSYIHGVWLRTPLPSVSIAHSQGKAFVAIGAPHDAIGIDAEPMTRQLAVNAFDMMARGSELALLNQHPGQAMRSWVAKEAVQKSLGLGMHLNPRDVQIPIGFSECEISIKNSNIQLSIWEDSGYYLAVASRQGVEGRRTPEDDLLDATLANMNANPAWGVGCRTQRSMV